MPDEPDVVIPDLQGDGDDNNTGDDQVAKDISATCLELALEESMLAHGALMTETRGNAQSAHSIIRHSGARKFNQEDPIEAASAEMILSGSPNQNISGVAITRARARLERPSPASFVTPDERIAKMVPAFASFTEPVGDGASRAVGDAPSPVAAALRRLVRTRPGHAHARPRRRLRQGHVQAAPRALRGVPRTAFAPHAPPRPRSNR